MSIPIGTRLGPYEVLALVGAGGMGQVYTARDLRLDRIVAVKVLSGDPQRRARFEREARTIAGLSHPHICSLFDVGEYESSLFLVMEHLQGVTLAGRLAAARVPLDETRDIAVQVAEAINAAHAQGIVHRDIKPANIFIVEGGHVKVVDFGLARRVADTPSSRSTRSHRLHLPRPTAAWRSRTSLRVCIACGSPACPVAGPRRPREQAIWTFSRSLSRSQPMRPH